MNKTNIMAPEKAKKRNSDPIDMSILESMEVFGFTFPACLDEQSKQTALNRRDMIRKSVMAAVIAYQ
jgi:hypothetical protein